MKGITLSAVFVLCFLTGSWSKPQPDCECPPKNEPCHKTFPVASPCLCEICLTRCYERENICGVNKTCIEEPFIYNGKDLGKTAKCEEFTECQKVTCTTECPKSGFYYDFNGCQTCLCEDPCKEKCPTGKCSNQWTINLGTEPNYVC